MNRAIFKLDIKSNWLFFLVILAIMLMYMSVIAMMYDPGSLEAMTMLLDSMPKQLISAMGFDDMGTSLTGFMASYYYGFIIILFPMIFAIVLSGKLISRYVDRSDTKKVFIWTGGMVGGLGLMSAAVGAAARARR